MAEDATVVVCCTVTCCCGRLPSSFLNRQHMTLLTMRNKTPETINTPPPTRMPEFHPVADNMIPGIQRKTPHMKNAKIPAALGFW